MERAVALPSAIRSIVIVGGGIAGLALAHLLRSDSSLRVSVFERDPSPEARTQGYYIGLQMGGLKVVQTRLLALVPGLSELLGDEKMSLSGLAMFDDRLSMLMGIGTDSSAFQMHRVSRGGLRAALARALPAEMIRWGCQFDRYEESADGVVAHFKDGTHVKADLLVGADGSRSEVRRQRCPSLQLDDVGITAMAGTFELRPELDLPVIRPNSRGALVRVLGLQGHTLLLMRYNPGDQREMVLWSLSWPTDSRAIELEQKWREHKQKRGQHSADAFEGAKTPAELEIMAQVHEDSLRRAREYFRSAEVAACIQQTPVSELFPLRQVYSTPDKYASSRTPPPLGTCATRVTLIGDALHAMTTHRGMGANTAIEDAADLADFLLQHPSAWREGLTTLERKITIRGFANVASSLKSTRMLHARGVLALARNWLMWGVGWGISIFFFVRGIFSRRRK